MKISLTKAQSLELLDEITLAGNLEGFLLKEKAIKKAEDGSWIVMSYDGLVGTPARFGFNHGNNTPFTFWRLAVEEAFNFQRKKEYAQKKTGEYHDKMAAESGELPETIQRPRNAD